MLALVLMPVLALPPQQASLPAAAVHALPVAPPTPQWPVPPHAAVTLYLGACTDPPCLVMEYCAKVRCNCVWVAVVFGWWRDRPAGWSFIYKQP